MKEAGDEKRRIEEEAKIGQVNRNRIDGSIGEWEI